MASMSMLGSMMSRQWQPPVRQPWEKTLRGFPREVLAKQPVSEDFICGLCDFLLRQPVQNLCGHRFCFVCTYDKKEIPCPLCLEEPDEDMRMDSVLGPNTVHPDNALRRSLALQQARCPDCDWSGLFGEYETSHYEECGFHKMSCPDCGVLLTVRDLDEHKARYCTRRHVPCSRCGQVIPATTMEQHVAQECPKTLVKCDSCPAPPMARENLLEHYAKDCKVLKIQCPYGCIFVFIEPSKLEEHEKISKYKHVRSQNSRVIELESIECTEPNDDVVESLSEWVAATKQKVENLDRCIQARQGGISIPTEITDKVSKFEQACSDGYEKLGFISSKLERVEESTFQKQLAIAQAAKDGHKLAEKAETHNTLLTQTIEDLKERLRALEETSFNGTLLWPVREFSVHMAKARDHSPQTVHSPIFYTSKYGHCMRIRLYPYGEGIARGTHMSLHIQLMPGNYDALLKWPFRQKITFTVVNQRNPGEGDLVNVFEPDGSSLAFRRPSSTRLSNPASGCTHFANIAKFQPGSDFLLDNDTLFVKCAVDVSGLKQ